MLEEYGKRVYIAELTIYNEAIKSEIIGVYDDEDTAKEEVLAYINEFYSNYTLVDFEVGDILTANGYYYINSKYTNTTKRSKIK